MKLNRLLLKKIAQFTESELYACFESGWFYEAEDYVDEVIIKSPNFSKRCAQHIASEAPSYFLAFLPHTLTVSEFIYAAAVNKTPDGFAGAIKCWSKEAGWQHLAGGDDE